MNDLEAIRIYREQGRRGRAPLSTDPPQHRRYRDLIDGFFSQRGADQQRELIERVVNELIDAFIGDEEILFTTDHLYIGGNETTTCC